MVRDAALPGFLRTVCAGTRDDLCHRAFLDAIAAALALPCPASIVGLPVRVVALRFDPASRRGLLAEVEAGSRRQAVCLADLDLDPDLPAANLLAAYRAWLGGPRADGSAASGPLRDDPLPEGPVELIVLACRGARARCGDLTRGDEVTLRMPRDADWVPGEVLTLVARRAWSRGARRFLSGRVTARHVGPERLALPPLAVHPRGPWDPADACFPAAGQPVHPCLVPILQAGPRPAFAMEQVLPRLDAGDPVLRALALHRAGDREEARALLLDLADSDLRCLDAHAHLGAFAFEDHPERALRHYEVGVRLGEHALGPSFRGVLPWEHADNRPFLRCLEGWGLCLWRQGRLDEALAALERLLWLNPGDHQGARYLLPAIRRGEPWRPDPRGA